MDQPVVPDSSSDRLRTATVSLVRHRQVAHDRAIRWISKGTDAAIRLPIMVCSGRFPKMLVVVLGLLSIARSSRADWTDRRLVLETMAGFGTPVGLLGLVARVDPIPWVSVGGGIGASIGGLEYAALLLGRAPIAAGPKWLTALTLGSSYSVGGTYHHNPNPSCWVEDCRDRWVHSAYRVEDAHWLSAELGVETRSRNGISFRGFAGLAKLTNPASVTCQNYDASRNEWVSGPCTAPLPDAASAQDLFPDISGPPGMPDVIWVLGAAFGYAI